MALGGSRSHCGREILERGFKNVLEDVRGRWGGSLLFWPRRRRDIGGNDKAGLHGMAIGVCVVEQAPELEQIELASSRGEGWILCAQAVKPAEQMGIAAQLGEGAQVREIGLNIAEKAPSGDSIALYRLRSQGSCKSLNAGIKDLREDRMG
jgi:hypothetical protein